MYRVLCENMFMYLKVDRNSCEMKETGKRHSFNFKDEPETQKKKRKNLLTKTAKQVFMKTYKDSS